MICFECGLGELAPALVELTGIRKNESFTVNVQGLRCDACGFKTVDSDQSAEFTKAVSDAYRLAHLIASGDCRAQRADEDAAIDALQAKADAKLRELSSHQA